METEKFQRLWWNPWYKTTKASLDVCADFTSEFKTRSGCINDKRVVHDEVKPTAWN